MTERKPQRLSERERIAALRLIRTESIGPVSFRRLVSRFGSAAAALEALPSLAGASGRREAMKPYPLARAEDELAAAARIGARLVAADEPDYPAALALIADAPPLLYARGDLAIGSRPAVAIVGARNASLAGRRVAAEIAQGLGAAGVAVASGLARGIDASAHAAALDTGTIAVVAGGADVIYPPENAGLTAEIVSRGLLISEQPPGAAPTARDFPRRNRLISGLSQAVVIVEAALRSGTLITARFALEQGREVCAVPGSPLDPRSHGSNRLIKEGACLIERAEDVLEAIRAPIAARRAGSNFRDGFLESDGTAPEALLNPTPDMRARVLELLGYTPTHRDDLLREIDAPAGVVIDCLIDLVLSGAVEECPGGKFALRP